MEFSVEFRYWPRARPDLSTRENQLFSLGWYDCVVCDCHSLKVFCVQFRCGNGKGKSEIEAGWTWAPSYIVYVVPQTISQDFGTLGMCSKFFLEGIMKVKITLAVLGTVVVVGIVGTLFKFNPGKS